MVFKIHNFSQNIFKKIEKNGQTIYTYKITKRQKILHVNILSNVLFFTIHSPLSLIFLSPKLLFSNFKYYIII